MSVWTGRLSSPQDILCCVSLETKVLCRSSFSILSFFFLVYQFLIAFVCFNANFSCKSDMTDYGFRFTLQQWRSSSFHLLPSCSIDLVCTSTKKQSLHIFSNGMLIWVQSPVTMHLTPPLDIMCQSIITTVDLTNNCLIDSACSLL